MNLFNRTLKVGDLIKIDKGRIGRSQELPVKYIKSFNVLKPETFLDKVLKLFKGKTYRFYRVFKFEVNEKTVYVKITPALGKSNLMKNTIYVFCSCPDFKYRAAYGLNKTGNLFLNKPIKVHLGNALTEKPSKITPTRICKHCYVVIDFIQNNLDILGLALK